MRLKTLPAIVFLTGLPGLAFAINPVYEGENGIRAQVFDTNCISCHSSALVGIDRNDAPASVNFDTYQSAVGNAPDAIVEAVENFDMPPSSSGVAFLNNEQKAALLAWRDADYPRYAIDPVYSGDNGIRAQVFATNCLSCHSSELVGIDRNDAPRSVNFDTYQSALENAAQAIVEAVEDYEMPPSTSGIAYLNNDQKTALLVWRDAGFPENASSDTTAASYQFDTGILTLPLIQVGDINYTATLRSIELAASPIGVGFQLETVEETTATANANNAPSYNLITGILQIPSVNLLQGSDTIGRSVAELKVVAHSQPLTFSLISAQSGE